jgi:hypothetical protein
MLKRVIVILAAMWALCGCIPSLSPAETYSITGEIIDPDACLERALADMHVIATDKSTGKIYPGSVGTEDVKTCRYALENLPAGDYLLHFSSPYYEIAEYPVALQGNKTLDVTLSPIPLFSLDVEELYFAPRVKTRQFSITNVTEKPVSLSLYPNDVIALLVRSIPGFQKMNGTIGWRGQLDAGETKTVTVEIQHDDKESLREGSLALEFNGMRLSSIPLVIETTSRDFYGNLVGRVTDEQGHPLKDIPVYCNCTDTIVLSDEDGRYSFDDLPYVSQVQVIALSEFYNWKMSEFKEYVRDEIEINLSLERCRNHLTLDRQEIDFGTGSVSHPGAPVSFEINVTAETDAPVMFRVQTKVLGGDVYPGLHYVANGSFQSTQKLWFQLDRSVGNVGDFQFTAILWTDCAGVYLIPVKFSNTE